MEPKLEREGASIVLRGRFNPAIFQPAWFARFKLLRETETEATENLVVSNDVSSFSCGWLRLSVTKDRFAAHSADAAHYEPLRDLVLGVFSLLEHTPFHVMGLNRHAHYRIDSEDSWHKIGDELAPKEIWRPLVAGRPGLRSLTIQAERPESQSRQLHIRIEPSLEVRPHGVYFDTNEHFQVEEKDEQGSQTLMQHLRDSWVASMNFSQATAVGVFASIKEDTKT